MLGAGAAHIESKVFKLRRVSRNDFAPLLRSPGRTLDVFGCLVLEIFVGDKFIKLVRNCYLLIPLKCLEILPVQVSEVIITAHSIIIHAAWSRDLTLMLLRRDSHVLCAFLLFGKIFRFVALQGFSQIYNAYLGHIILIYLWILHWRLWVLWKLCVHRFVVLFWRSWLL